MSRIDSVGLAKQTGAGDGGLGTRQTVMEYFVPVESASPGINTEEMTAEETLGIPFPTDRANGVQFFEPTMSGKCRGAGLPRILSAFLGDPLTTTPDAAGAPTARNHNFNPVARPTPRALSILLNRTDPVPAITDLIWDAMGQSLELAVSADDWITFDATLVAKEIDETQPEPSVTADLTRRFAFHECKAYISVNGGAEVETAIDEYTLGYDLNVPTDNKVLGSRRLFKMEPGNRDAALSFTPKQDLSAWYRRAILLEPDSVKVRLEALGPVIGAAVRHKIELIVHRCQTIDAEADIDAGETLKGVPITLHPAYDSAAAKFVEANIVNTVNTY